jgi:hypothetical protein
MRPIITIDNYEEIMFRLVENDFDAQTRTDLLQQIETDALFKFEWEAWQKTRFVDPLESYLAESFELETKIVQIAEPELNRRKLILYFSVAATFLLLISILYFLTPDFYFKIENDVPKTYVNHVAPEKKAIPTAKPLSVPVKVKKQIKHVSLKNEVTPVLISVIDNPVEQPKNLIAETTISKDSVPVKTQVLGKSEETKPRYKVTIETVPLDDISEHNIDLALNRKGKLSKIFTNTQFLLRRKTNGEPEKIILVGEENSYLCINLNY